MSVRGRRPKPASRQIAEGDPRKRGNHKLQGLLNAEPEATRGLPSCPRHLRGRARSAWNFWAEELALMDLDRRPDAPLLECACIAYQQATYAYETVQKEGYLMSKRAIDPASGELVVTDTREHPAVKLGNDARKQVQSFCGEFGLSPVSRTRLSIDRQDRTPDLLTMLSKPREKRESSTTVQ